MFAPSDYHFELPAELIAQEATAERAASRLLHVGADGSLADLQFPAIVDLLPADAILVVNDTRVIPARVLTKKPSGGAIEILFLHPEGAAWRALARGTVRPGMVLAIDGDPATITVASDRAADGSVVVETSEPVLPLLERVGHIPLPHYIERADRPDDRARYQTMFAANPGAVASPTAGLHMTPAIAAALEARGVTIARITLHVGLGTFEPIRTDDIRAHQMHSERYTIPEATAALLATGRPVVALGTTALRALEASQGRASAGETNLFIYPGSGHQFRVVDHLITNFHLPASTLLMLVSAFAGRDAILAAYRHAVAARYRFFSYGDAMLIHRC